MFVDDLIAQAERIVRESGDPEGFDAASWVERWLDTPHPALGGRRPSEYLGAAKGRTRLSNLLNQQQASVYV